MRAPSLCAVIALASACSSRVAPGPVAGDEVDAAIEVDGAIVVDAGTSCVTPAGESGDCLATSACAALPGHTSIAHACPGPADIQCCVITPSVAANPPVPAGFRLMKQADVTTEMTTWAVAILHDPVTYPMFATATRAFGAVTVLARVEWHPPDFQNHVIHRGVTLYVPS